MPITFIYRFLTAVTSSSLFCMALCLIARCSIELDLRGTYGRPSLINGKIYLNINPEFRAIQRHYNAIKRKQYPGALWPSPQSPSHGNLHLTTGQRSRIRVRLPGTVTLSLRVLQRDSVIGLVVVVEERVSVCSVVSRTCTKQRSSA